MRQRDRRSDQAPLCYRELSEAAQGKWAETHQVSRSQTPVCQAHDKKIFTLQKQKSQTTKPIDSLGFLFFISHSITLPVMYDGLSLLFFSKTTSVVAPHSSQCRKIFSTIPSSSELSPSILSFLLLHTEQ